MSEKKLTPWFPSTTPPVHEGPYEREYTGGIFFSYFGNGNWHWCSKSVNDAERNYQRKVKSKLMGLRWRGVVK